MRRIVGLTCGVLGGTLVLGTVVLILLSLLGAFPRDRVVVSRDEVATYPLPREPDTEGATLIASGTITAAPGRANSAHIGSGLGPGHSDASSSAHADDGVSSGSSRCVARRPSFSAWSAVSHTPSRCDGRPWHS